MSREGEILAGKYRIERVLGQGGMGIVLGARHIQLDEPVAIKLLHQDLVGDPDVVERFMREARNAAKIKSDHVARVTDVDRLESGTPYMVMEYLEGTDLAALLATRGSISAREAVDYVLQACDALGEAHARGIFHRDLKPANMFLTRTRDGAPRVKILDFGISKATATGERELTQTAASMGTPSYMSPEQIISARSVDGRTDIWSLGCVLFKLVTGAVPFRRNGEQAVQHAILYLPPTPPSQIRPDLSPVLEEIILRCIEKLPERRYPTVSALVVALEAFQAEAVSAPSGVAAPALPADREKSVTDAHAAPAIGPSSGQTQDASSLSGARAAITGPVSPAITGPVSPAITGPVSPTITGPASAPTPPPASPGTLTPPPSAPSSLTWPPRSPAADERGEATPWEASRTDNSVLGEKSLSGPLASRRGAARKVVFAVLGAAGLVLVIGGVKLLMSDPSIETASSVPEPAKTSAPAASPTVPEAPVITAPPPAPTVAPTVAPTTAPTPTAKPPAPPTATVKPTPTVKLSATVPPPPAPTPAAPAKRPCDPFCN